jgi:predicted metal-dependent hydrolase
MPTTIQLGDFSANVVFKDIKNVHLSVYPPNGRVHIAAPSRMALETLRVYAISKLGWIKQQQKRLQAQKRETARVISNRESHYLWGKRYLLKVVEKDQSPSVELGHKQLLLAVRPGTPADKKETLLSTWYRQQLRNAVIPIVKQWEKTLGVEVNSIFIQRMKTKWGSCNHQRKNIRLNAELAKKPRECLEYIVVHEMMHLFVPNHGVAFRALMDKHLPHWEALRQLLNETPLAHIDWDY